MTAIESMLGDWQLRDCAVPLSKGYSSRSVYLDTFIEKAFSDQGFTVIRIYPVYIRYNTKDEVEHVMKQWFDEAIEKAKSVDKPLILLERVETLYSSYHKFFANYVREGIQIKHSNEQGEEHIQYVPFMLCSDDDYHENISEHFFGGYSQFVKYSRLDNCPVLQKYYDIKQDINKTERLTDTSNRILAYQNSQLEAREPGNEKQLHCEKPPF